MVKMKENTHRASSLGMVLLDWSAAITYRTCFPLFIFRSSSFYHWSQVCPTCGLQFVPDLDNLPG